MLASRNNKIHVECEMNRNRSTQSLRFCSRHVMSVCNHTSQVDRHSQPVQYPVVGMDLGTELPPPPVPERRATITRDYRTPKTICKLILSETAQACHFGRTLGYVQTCVVYNIILSPFTARNRTVGMVTVVLSSFVRLLTKTGRRNVSTEIR